MATATLYEAEFDGGQVTLTMTYNTATLKLTGLTYVNPTSQPGTLILSGVANDTITMPANANASVPLSGVTLVKSQITDKFGTRTVIELPGGESVQFTWPSG